MRKLTVLVLSALVIAGCHHRHHSSSGGSGNSDETPPVVSSTVPSAGAPAVVVYNSVVATFSEDMEASTVSSASFTVSGPGATSVPGSVSYDPTTHKATFTPTIPLTGGVLYTARITTAVTDLAGNAMSFDYVWTFTTAVDVTRPIVVSTVPLSGDTNVATDRSIVAYFSEAMNASTVLTAMTVTGPGSTPVAGAVSYDATNHAVKFLPTLPLAISTTFTVTITTAAKDVAGNPMAAAYVWTFTTGISTDSTRPTVTSTSPADLDTLVPLNATVTAFFSEPMDASTFTSLTFTLNDGGPVAGTISCPSPGSFVTFKPNVDLAISTVYTATITTGVTDLAGNSLLVSYVWHFTTGTTVMTGQAPLDLKTAGNFAVLAGSAVTSTGPTNITGDVGCSPGSSIGGLSVFPLFTPGTVHGLIWGPGPTADQAKLDLTAAYLDAASRSVDSISCPGNLGGLTLAPGLYTNSTSVMISGTGPLGILTLDAGAAGSSAVWIFQMGSTLTTDPGTSIVLAGGASEKNIYWQVGTSATIGTTCIFKGNILAQASITMNTGATLDLGRVLTQTGGVTLDANVISKP